MDRKDEGATAVEYGLIVAGIAAVILAAVFALGVLTSANFASFVDSLTAALG